jgi:hypothetical protein
MLAVLTVMPRGKTCRPEYIETCFRSYIAFWSGRRTGRLKARMGYYNDNGRNIEERIQISVSYLLSKAGVLFILRFMLMETT